jgi:Uma2 family endonuclease
MADLLERLGGISPRRVRLRPAPGTATEDDLIQVARDDDRLYELVEGTLVEKGMGYSESLLAGWLLAAIRSFVEPRNLGLVSGADGMVRLFPGLVRIPDLAFVSWDRIPGRRVPKAPIPGLVPDLVVEVLSRCNTAAEMARKVREYREASVRLIWIIDPRKRTALVHGEADPPIALGPGDVLDGGPVLPGLQIALDQLFAELDRTG